MLTYALAVASQPNESISSLIFDPSNIDIVRDTFGVPHIFGKTDPEVAYGLAWAHAEDDFETLQKSFLVSKSMLGLQTGRDGATVDYLVYLLRIRDLVERKYEADISTPFKNLLVGYCEGVNAYARAHPKEVLVKRSFPITPQDLVTYSVLQMTIGCGADVALKKIFNGQINFAELEAQGSNAFAFNSKITADSSVYLAINTHHPMESQVSWYEAHLHSEEGWNILGATFPGAPVIFTGVNPNLGWTHTVNHPDRLDVYQLQMNPDNALQYKVDSMWLTLEERTVKLKVKMPGFNAHVKKKTYWSIYGPTIISEKGVFSIRTSSLMDIRGLEQWYWMNKSQNFKQFKTALEMQALASYNIVYGDRFDTIFYVSNGRIPIRAKGYEWRGTVPGNTSKTLWTEIHGFDALPQVLNPRSGYLFNANHSPFNATSADDNIVAADYNSSMGYELHDNNRSYRVMELMEQLEKVSFNDFKRIKYDLQLPEKLAFPVNLDTLFLLDEKIYPEYANLLSALKSWDRAGATDSHGAALFAIGFYYVAAKYQKDETLKYLSTAQSLETLAYIQSYLMKYFRTVEITLGDYQRLERGDRSLPLPGLPDVLAAMYSTPTEDGRVKGTLGECYVSLTKFTKAGPEIETINCYGASNRKRSPHYDDQMELFQQQKTKPMTLDKVLIYKYAKSVYHPESFSRIAGVTRLKQR